MVVLSLPALTKKELCGTRIVHLPNVFPTTAGSKGATVMQRICQNSGHSARLVAAILYQQKEGEEVRQLRFLVFLLGRYVCTWLQDKGADEDFNGSHVNIRRKKVRYENTPKTISRFRIEQDGSEDIKIEILHSEKETERKHLTSSS